MTKLEKYKALVSQRKACQKCMSGRLGIHNGDKIAKDNNLHETENIGPWFEWAGVNCENALDAKIVILGQDWFPDTLYIKELKKYGEMEYKPLFDEKIATDKTLNEMVKKIDPNIDLTVNKKENHKLFFTNLILCYKEGAANQSIPSSYYGNCRESFLKCAA